MQSEMKKRVDELLPKFGVTKLKPFQEKCIERLLLDNDTFCVQNTGSGKSLCYQIPALLMSGVTIVVSPLISLIDDQIKSLKDRKIDAVSFYHRNEDDKSSPEKELENNRNIKLIYTTPETLWYRRDYFYNLDEVSMLVIDEVHCVSAWDQSFRPAYRCIGKVVEGFKEKPVIAAFTATIDERVFKNITDNLSLKFSKNDCIGTVKRKIDFPKKPDNRKIFLYEKEGNPISKVCKLILDSPDKKTLVFCCTHKQVNELLEKLDAVAKKKGIDNLRRTKYYSGIPGEEADRARKNHIHILLTTMQML